MTIQPDKKLSPKHRYIRAVIVLVIILELLTCMGRFVIGFSVKEHESAVTALTFGVRIHHGYTGLAFVIVAAAVGRFTKCPRKHLRKVSIFGVALVVSDFIHHFIVLYLVTGSTEFP